ncbi:MAG TPA: hypothetical protein PKD79_01305 [Candidatus Doudnabacteria bacterium]|nr:hypothetical protein [Candidatus Doudnabacteria bacterium]
MKRIIYIIIFVLAAGGAIVMGYLAFTGEGNDATTLEGGSAVTPVYNILPEGKSLDFTTVKNFNRDGRLFNYPEVNTFEIGQSLNNLME